MRNCESAPEANQADANDGGKTHVLARYDAPRRNSAREEQSQQKRVVDICGSEGSYARRQHRQILIHKGLLSFPDVSRGEGNIFSNVAPTPPVFLRNTVQRSRALLTDSRKRRASSAMRPGCRWRMASLGISSPPTPSAIAPAAMKLNAVRWFTPPAAIIGTSGNIALRSLM